MMAFDKVLLLLLDSVGAGSLPDAAAYGDEGAATLRHVIEHCHPHLPNLTRLGMLAANGLPSPAPEACWGRCASRSRGKDSIVGHWEIMGEVTQIPFQTYPDGFPPEIINAFVQETGCGGVLGNCAASGTEIIARLGPEHQRTGWPIVYTSADSVFQIAAHEDVVPVPTLYRWCQTARDWFDSHRVGMGRVIARPFVGQPGSYTRTANRHDYAAAPPSATYMDALAQAGVPALSIGKPYDIFLGRGFSAHEKTASNTDGLARTLAALPEAHGLIFTNLVDFDSKWGHRRNAEAYAAGLEEVDRALPALMDALGDDGLLVITADHGCDPCWKGTDHTREYIPFLLWHKGIQPAELGTRPCFADVGATILDALGVEAPGPGQSVWAVRPGRYRHFKGGQYQVLGTAQHSETREPMVVYRALYGEGGLWVRPAAMWNESVEQDGQRVPRFTRIGD